MEQPNERYIDLEPKDLLEVTIAKPDDFLKVRETLTRIGVSSRKEKKLWQSCHILHKRGKYYIVHFKEMFALDDLPTSIDSEDIGRRNTIACLLEEWGLLKIVNKEKIADKVPLNKIKILPHKEKGEWELCPKYHIGRSKPGNKPESED
jgi:hypothetical protein